MTNNSSFYRWTTFKNGIGFAAMVTLNVEPNPLEKNQIIEHYSGQGFTGQGNIEEVPENGYDPWKVAARAGLAYAFSLIDSHWIVSINKIEGRNAIDTNPTIVGYTVLRAFFDKINFHLTTQQIEILEAYVVSSRITHYKELIPDFFTLTFK